MIEIIGNVSIVLFLSISLYEMLITTLTKKVRVPPVLVTIYKYIGNVD